MNWDEHAGTWDEGGAQRAYAQHAFEALERVLARAGESMEEARVCDFGCGTGLLTERLAGQARWIDAVDNSPAMLAVLEAKALERGWSQVQLHTKLESASGPYDLIVCSSVCGFLDDYPGTVAQMAQRLRPGGLFVQWDWELDPASENGMGLSRQEITACLEAAGLEVLVVETAFSIEIKRHMMRPLMGAGRRLLRDLGLEPISG